MDEFLAQEEGRNEIFSQQFQHEISVKLVGCNDVVERFLGASNASKEEKRTLSDVKVADKKIRRLMEIMTQNYHKRNMQPLKTFIEVLEETKNDALARQLSTIYTERVNSLGILSRLEKEKSLVASLKREITRLQLLLEEGDNTLSSLKQAKSELTDRVRLTENAKKEAIQKVKHELEIKISQKEEYICTVGKELEELSTRKQHLETEVISKSTVINSRTKEMEDKEMKLQTAIQESNELRSEIEHLRNNFVQVIGKQRDEMSKKIENLEDDIVSKENEIVNLRKNQVLTRGELETELRKITTGQEKKIDELMNVIKQQEEKNEDKDKKIDNLTDKVDKMMEYLLESKKQ